MHCYTKAVIRSIEYALGYIATAAAVVILFGASVDSARADSAVPDTSCIKGRIRGDASTYNPYVAGWRTGGSALATGGRYDPNSYAAALQFGAARSMGCGYGSGRVCDAVVETPEGRSLVLRINDNGPLVAGRVIDLNEKSMRYLSGGKYVNNSGVLRNVTVTVLCGTLGGFLGPLDAKDKAEWDAKTITTPAAHVNDVAGNSFFSGSSGNSGLIGNGGTNGRDPNGTNGRDPAGTTGGVGGTSGTVSGGAPPMPPSQQLQPQPLRTSSPPLTQILGGTPSLGIVARAIGTEGTMRAFVAWSSLNMDGNSCAVLGPDGGEIAHAQGGGQIVQGSAARGRFVLRCIARGQTMTASATVSP